MAAIVSRLQKLIAHERSARAIGNTQEAEAFAARIATLLTEYKLSMTEVEFEAQNADDPIGRSDSSFRKARPERWQTLLADAVAVSFYCQVLCAKKEGIATGVFVWVGRASDRSAAIEMFEYLSVLGQEFARGRTQEIGTSPYLEEFRTAVAHSKEQKAHLNRELRKVLNGWTSDFMFGFADSLHRRLTSNRRDLEAGSASTGLIVRDQAAVEQFVSEAFQTREIRRRAVSLKYNSAYGEGVKVGQEVALHARTGLGSGS